MRIRSVEVRNYKSFWKSGTINLHPQFNIVFGPNNAGKTALVEAIAGHSGRPHSSLTRTPMPGNADGGLLVCEWDDELRLRILGSNRRLAVRIRDGESSDQALNRVCNAIGTDSAVCIGANRRTRFASDEFEGQEGMGVFGMVNTNTWQASYAGVVDGPYFIEQMGDAMREAIFVISAERPRVATCMLSQNYRLQSDAQNLANVLQGLSNNSPGRFAQIVKEFIYIFPDVKDIRLPITESSLVEIMLWMIDPSTDRRELAYPLAHSGTGLGQVLVVLTALASTERTVIVIDEPQSFLHPGAMHALLDVLQEHPNHQYIITTHSPIFCRPDLNSQFILLEKRDGVSHATVLDGMARDASYALLRSIGSRPSDVFGAEGILWVEGATEEVIFPKFLGHLGIHLGGVRILGVVDVGRLRSKKHRDLVLDIYRKMSKAGGVIPPAVGFFFDGEDATAHERTEISRDTRGAVILTTKMMLESYLLHPLAISNVLKRIHPDGTKDCSADAVCGALERAQFPENGALTLSSIFDDLSGHTVSYDKVIHGAQLADEILLLEPHFLKPIFDELRSAINSWNINYSPHSNSGST